MLTKQELAIATIHGIYGAAMFLLGFIVAALVQSGQ